MLSTYDDTRAMGSLSTPTDELHGPSKVEAPEDVACHACEVHTHKIDEQIASDLIDEACMESFPCSDPPSYTTSHA